MRRPLVAVPGYPVRSGRIEGWVDAGIAVPAPYVEALKRSGAQEAILMPEELDDESARNLVGHFDGLLLIGGPDLDPAHYGQAPDTHLYGLHPTRDAFELALCRAALEVRLPMLTICRGTQVLNVALGGTLHQHISDEFPGHGIPGVEGGQHVHEVCLDGGTRLAQVMGELRPQSSCHHHQALDRLGKGVTVTARSPDGIVEAVELETPDAGWVLGVQWHPEDTAASDSAQQRIFDAFVAAATD
jgi:putative glutamine amidotransferase